MTKAADFIARHGLDYRNIEIAREMGAYLEEMQKGLDGEESSLLMLPTYLELKENVRRERPVVCVDAGGTNLRVALAQFDAAGNFALEKIHRYKMPGVERPVSAQEFFDILAGLVAPFCEVTKEVVVSFAYRAKTTPDIDCEIIDITKEVEVVGAEGKLLGREIRASLERMGACGVNLIVINDSVATALSGKAEYLNEGYGTFTGSILGTGSNSCYLEDNAKIGKLPNLNPGVMVINTEAGSYDKMPRSGLDRAFDQTTQFPGVGVAEKMTSGGYLGALCGFVLKAAAEEGVFKTKAVEEMLNLSTADVSEYLENGSGVVEEYMLDEEDEQNARELLTNLVLRAARMAALQMAAMGEKACKTNNRLCMAIEGTTYEKMPLLKEELHARLLEYMEGRGYDADIVSVDNAVVKGCAIAGLSR